MSRKQLLDVVFDQQGAAQNTHDLEDSPVEFEVVLDNGNEAICDDGNMDLYSDGVLRFAPKGFDFEVLFNPFGKQFHLPAITIKQGDVLSREVEIVGIIDERPSEVGSVIDNPSEVGRVVSFVPVGREADCLVEHDIAFRIDGFVTIDNLEYRMSFFPDDEESPECVNSEEPCKVKVSALKDIAGIGLVREPIHSLVVADIGVCDSVEYRYLGDDVNLSVNLDSRLCAAEMSPSEHGQTEVNRSGINGIETPMKFKLFGDSSLLGKRHHVECILLENPRVAEHVCLCEGVSDDRRCPKPKIVRPFSMSCGDICEFSETSTPDELSEHEHKQLVPVRKTPVFCSVVELRDNSPELSLRKKHGDLCEDILSDMHNGSFFCEEVQYTHFKCRTQVLSNKSLCMNIL